MPNVPPVPEGFTRPDVVYSVGVAPARYISLELFIGGYILSTGNRDPLSDCMITRRGSMIS